MCSAANARRMRCSEDEGNTMMIELTAQQSQALLAQHGKPVDVVDSATRQQYVLVLREMYDRMRWLLEPQTEHQAEIAAGIPSGVLQSQQAYWRQLPELLSQEKLKGQWICFSGDERIGIAATERALIGKCLQRGLTDSQYYTDIIQPRTSPPWEIEEVEPRPWFAQEETGERKPPNQP